MRETVQADADNTAGYTESSSQHIEEQNNRCGSVAVAVLPQSTALGRSSRGGGSGGGGGGGGGDGGGLKYTEMVQRKVF